MNKQHSILTMGLTSVLMFGAALIADTGGSLPPSSGSGAPRADTPSGGQGTGGYVGNEVGPSLDDWTGNRYWREPIDEPAGGSGGDGPLGNEAPEATCALDTDGDGYVGPLDIVQVLAQWGACTTYVHEGIRDDFIRHCTADVNRSGYVDFDDLVAVMSAAGRTCSEIGTGLGG